MFGQRAGVDLGGDLGVRRDVESLGEAGENRADLVGREHIGRAAAEMDIADRQTLAQRRGDEVDFAKQARDIVLDRAASVDHGRVTAAVPAHAVAEGDVEIGRQGA